MLPRQIYEGEKKGQITLTIDEQRIFSGGRNTGKVLRRPLVRTFAGRKLPTKKAENQNRGDRGA